jgi:hypothetical protein
MMKKKKCFAQNEMKSVRSELWKSLLSSSRLTLLDWKRTGKIIGWVSEQACLGGVGERERIHRDSITEEDVVLLETRNMALRSLSEMKTRKRARKSFFFPAAIFAIINHHVGRDIVSPLFLRHKRVKGERWIAGNRRAASWCLISKKRDFELIFPSSARWQRSGARELIAMTLGRADTSST